MSLRLFTPPIRLCALSLFMAGAVLMPAIAEKADRSKPMVVEADKPGSVDLQKQINELSDKIKSMGEQTKTQQGAIEKLESEKSALETVRNELSMRTTEIAAERDTLRRERDQFQTACTDLVARLETLSGKVKTLEEDFVNLREIEQPSATGGN